MEKMMNKKTEGNTFTKKIGQTVYVVRYHFNEDAKETMQEKINRMLVTEASRKAMQWMGAETIGIEICLRM